MAMIELEKLKKDTEDKVDKSYKDLMFKYLYDFLRECGLFQYKGRVCQYPNDCSCGYPDIPCANNNTVGRK